jgi:hypothetical protein
MLTAHQAALQAAAIAEVQRRCVVADDRRVENWEGSGEDEARVPDWDADHRALAEEDRSERQMRWFER